MPSLFFLGQIVPAFYGDSPEKKWILAFRFAGSLKGIGIDTDRSSACDV